SSSSRYAADSATTNANKERLLQMRAVRHKNASAAATKTTEGSSPSTTTTSDCMSPKSKKSPPLIMPPSSITVSKVNTSEKRKLDMQKLNKCGSENKRPSLEIMLVNAPTSTQSGSSGTNKSSSVGNKVGTSVTIKTSGNNNSGDSESSKKNSSQNDNKNSRPMPSTIPVMRIKKPSGSNMRSPTGLPTGLRAPSGLTITPAVVPSNKTNDSSGNGGHSKVDSPRASTPKDAESSKDNNTGNATSKDSSEAAAASDDHHMKHDDIGALDLSGKSSRSKDSSPQSSPEMKSPSPGACPSPAKPTSSSTASSTAAG
ncbi:Polycomb complex protein BMI-1-B, partial [Gryllus bimaculatus]